MCTLGMYLNITVKNIFQYKMLTVHHTYSYLNFTFTKKLYLKYQKGKKITKSKCVYIFKV